jgi:hypothetical protein
MAEPTKKRAESAEALAAFNLFRGLGPKRTLRAAEEAWKAGQSASGIRIVSKEESVQGAAKGRRKRASGRFSLWSRQHEWFSRAAKFDQEVAAHIATQAKDQIEKMSARHASQAEVEASGLMAPGFAFVKAMQDPERRTEFEGLPMAELFRLMVAAAAQSPRIRADERISRGCAILVPGTAGSSPQGPATWNVSVWAPPRAQLLPDTTNKPGEATEWEDWQD